MLFLLASLAMATPADCLGDWAAADDPDASTTERCVQVWLADHLPGEPDFTLDPFPGHAAELGLTAAQLRRMAEHVRGACDTPEEQTTPCGWLIEYFEAAADQRFRLVDAQYQADLEPLLRRVLAGERLSRDDVAVSEEVPRYSPLSLWLLEHAVYARHGKAFEHPDLQRFFYDEGAVSDTDLLPVDEGGFEAAALTEADRHNLALIRSYRAGG